MKLCREKAESKEKRGKVRFIVVGGQSGCCKQKRNIIERYFIIEEANNVFSIILIFFVIAIPAIQRKA